MNENMFCNNEAPGKVSRGKKKQLFNIKPLLMSVWVNYKKISKICTFYSEVNNTVCAA